MTRNNGFTVIELTIVTALMSVIVSAMGYMFVVSFRLSNQGYDRMDIQSDILSTMTLVGKNLRQASSIDELTESSVTFTADLGHGEETYRFYLYHPDDDEPNPPYTQDSFQLRWAQNTVSYGSGAVLAKNIARPTTPLFTQNSNLITVDLTARHAEETFRVRTNIRPRNL